MHYCGVPRHTQRVISDKTLAGNSFFKNASWDLCQHALCYFDSPKTNILKDKQCWEYLCIIHVDYDDLDKSWSNCKFSMLRTNLWCRSTSARLKGNFFGHHYYCMCMYLQNLYINIKNLSRNDFLFFLKHEVNNFTFTCVITFMCHSPVSLIVIQPSYHNSYIAGQFLILNHFLIKIYAKNFHYFGYFLKNLFCLIDMYSYCATENLYSYSIYHSQIE